MSETSGSFNLLSPLAVGGTSRGMTGDDAWLQAMVDVEVALARGLVNERLAPDWMSDVADSLAHATDLDLAAIVAGSRSGGNPVIPLVKQLGLRAEAQHAGASDHIHVGATSQDILDSAAMVIARRVIDGMRGSLDELTESLVSLARLHGGTPMAGRTLGQHASPTSFGLVIAGWLDGITAARRRLDEVGRALPLQFGGSVGTRAILGEVVRARRPGTDAESIVAGVLRVAADRLELSDPDAPWHTNRIPIVELGSALAALVGAIGALAVDVSVLSRTEIAEVSERLGAGEGGSSAMPHKRNPVTAVLLVSAARRAPSLVATLFDSQIAEDQRPSGAWHAEWNALRELEGLALDAVDACASLASRLEVDVARMRANLDFTDGLIYSESVSAILGAAIGKDVAFDLMTEASREAVQTHRPLQVVVAGRLAAGEYSDEVRTNVLRAFDPENSLGSASAIIERVIARAKELS